MAKHKTNKAIQPKLKRYANGGIGKNSPVGGFWDNTLEYAGDVAGLTDPLGLGYGDYFKRKLGSAIGTDKAMEGEKVFDAVQGFQQGATRGALNAIPGGSMITKGTSFINQKVNPQQYNADGTPKQLYSGQNKLKKTAYGVGEIGGGVGVGVATGNVGGAASSGVQGLGDIFGATGMNNQGIQQDNGWTNASQAAGFVAPLAGAVGSNFNDASKLGKFAGTNIGKFSANLGQANQYYNMMSPFINMNNANGMYEMGGLHEYGDGGGDPNNPNKYEPIVIYGPYKLSDKQLKENWATGFTPNAKYKTKFNQTTDKSGKPVYNYTLTPYYENEVAPKSTVKIINQNDKPIKTYSKPIGDNNSEIIPMQSYNIKRFKDSTGKIINEKYYDFSGNEIKPMSIQYAMGGLNMLPNAEVEKQENSIAPNGEFTQYNGPSHENGGVPTQLDMGEIVFSDRLKPKGSNKTFADLNKKFNTNKEDKISEDVKANNLQKLTANLMKEAKLKQSMALYKQQEELKQSKLDNYAKRIGMSNSKFSNGGQYQKSNDRLDKESFIKKYYDEVLQNEYARTANLNGKISGPEQTSRLRLLQDLMFKYNDLDDKNYNTAYDKTMSGLKMIENLQKPYQHEDFTDVPSAYKKFAKGGQYLEQVGLGLAQNAGNIYDIYRSKKADTLNLQRYTPTLMNPSADLAANLRMYQDAKAQTAEASQGNASTYLNNMAAARAAKLNRDYATNMNYSNVNTGLMNEAAQYNAAQMDKEALFKLQSEAAARNLRASGISNMGQNVMSQYRGQNAEKTQNAYLDILAKKYPELSKDKELSGLFNR